ncbi:LysR family transcriptional regulator [Streptomyces sp. SCL15-4]|uniref:LysR family transcriptional regulator n=1 Tax=Streptomyces sp. SCL15-4 TaxID=2967221 RepID=UPI0029661B03|nr:LysR family transcriptional regulator [Streptomyces sp. SCL15-4]
MQRDIEVKLLRTLLAVVEEGGFARAAQSLHVTQPTVSQQVQRLESIVQTPVFHRTKRPLRLTPAGRELVIHARHVIRLNGDVLDRVSALCSQETLSMGCSIHFADGLGRMFSRLDAEMPHLRCAMVTDLSAPLADRVTEGDIDAALLLGTRTARAEMLGRVRLDWFGSPPPTAGRGVPIAQLGGSSALSLHIAETLDRNGVTWYAIPWCSDPHTVRASVQAGLACTALCENSHQKHPGIRPTPPGVLGPAPSPFPVYLAFSPALRDSVVDAVRAVARMILAGTPVDPP